MSDLIDRVAVLEDLEKRMADDYVDSARFAEYIRTLPSAEPERKWIPVTEALPEKEEYMLISKKPTKLSGSKWCVTIAIRTADPRSKKVNWRDIGFSVIPDDNVLAWMPLPEPYRGK